MIVLVAGGQMLSRRDQWRLVLWHVFAAKSENAARTQLGLRVTAFCGVVDSWNNWQPVTSSRFVRDEVSQWKVCPSCAFSLGWSLLDP